MPPPRQDSARLNAKKGCSSIGRASVSKTEGWGFETLRPCQIVLVASSAGAAGRPTAGAWGASDCRMVPGEDSLNGQVQSTRVYPGGSPGGGQGYLADLEGGVDHHPHGPADGRT